MKYDKNLINEKSEQDFLIFATTQIDITIKQINTTIFFTIPVIIIPQILLYIYSPFALDIRYFNLIVGGIIFLWCCGQHFFNPYNCSLRGNKSYKKITAIDITDNSITYFRPDRKTKYELTSIQKVYVLDNCVAFYSNSRYVNNKKQNVSKLSYISKSLFNSIEEYENFLENINEKCLKNCIHI